MTLSEDHKLNISFTTLQYDPPTFSHSSRPCPVNLSTSSQYNINLTGLSNAKLNKNTGLKPYITNPWYIAKLGRSHISIGARCAVTTQISFAVHVDVPYAPCYS
jgi:hypothetical protein